MPDDVVVQPKDGDSPTAIPAEAPVPKESDTPTESEQERVAQEAAAATEIKETKTELDALKKDHENLQKLYGDHTKEVSESRALIDQLTGRLAEMEEAVKAKGPDTQETRHKIAAIYHEIEEGNMSLGEGLAQIDEIKNQEQQMITQNAVATAVKQATDQFQTVLQKRDSDSVRQQFYKENPDFQDLVDSGALAEIRKANPMHDDFSAYYAYKAAENFEKGKAEQAKILEGAKVTDKF